MFAKMVFGGRPLLRENLDIIQEKTVNADLLQCVNIRQVRKP